MLTNMPIATGLPPFRISNQLHGMLAICLSLRLPVYGHIGDQAEVAGGPHAAIGAAGWEHAHVTAVEPPVSRRAFRGMARSW